MERREALLIAKRQSLEAVMTWTKKVEDEEKKLKDVEKLITGSSCFSNYYSLFIYFFVHGLFIQVVICLI